MRTTKSSVKGWLVSSVGVLAVVIGLLIAGGRGKLSVARAPVPASATAAPPSLAAPSPLSTPKAGRHHSLETHDKRADDFAPAIKMAIQNADELNDDRAVFELGYRWVAVAPEAALDFVWRLPFDNTLLIVALADEWTRRDPRSAAAWAAHLPEGEPRTRVLPSLVAVWAEGAPVEATRFASGLPPGDVKNEAVAAAMSGWSRQDPQAALGWARQFVQKPQQEQIYAQAVFNWSQRDPVAAAEWLGSMPDGPGRDSATSALCGALVARYPDIALSLAADISDRDVRNQRIENVARRWLESDRAAAENALIHSDLSAAFVSRLLR